MALIQLKCAFVYICQQVHELVVKTVIFMANFWGNKISQQKLMLRLLVLVPMQVIGAIHTRQINSGRAQIKGIVVYQNRLAPITQYLAKEKLNTKSYFSDVTTSMMLYSRHPPKPVAQLLSRDNIWYPWYFPCFSWFWILGTSYYKIGIGCYTRKVSFWQAGEKCCILSYLVE